MTVATTLGGVTLAYPDVPLNKSEIYNATQRRAADNTLLSSVSGGVKYKWRLKWSNLTAAEMSVVKARALVTAAQTWVPCDEDGVSYSCVVTRNTLAITPQPNADYYTIEFELEEA